MHAPCPLCQTDHETVLWQGTSARVVLVDDDSYPGFCRVIWQAHVPEMTDLAPAQRHELMELVFAVEATLRRTLQPTKINLASLGNQVPHLHWHVIPRYGDDVCYPDAIWAAPRRAGAVRSVDSAVLRKALHAVLPATVAGD